MDQVILTAGSDPGPNRPSTRVGRGSTAPDGVLRELAEFAHRLAMAPECWAFENVNSVVRCCDPCPDCPTDDP